MPYPVKILPEREPQGINPYIHNEGSRFSSLKVSDNNDPQEKQADAVADQVVLMPDQPEADRPLAMSPQTDIQLMPVSAPESMTGNPQNTYEHNTSDSLSGQLTSSSGNQPQGDIIQRSIELRPPGRGEASAFDRANELVDRINDLSFGIIYYLEGDGRTLNYRILIPEALSEFDFQLIEVINQDQVIPLRLITSHGRVGGNPVVGDTFLQGYVDLDDLMASDDVSFQSILLHILQERAATNRYAQRIGSPSLDSNTPVGRRAFNRGHRAGHTAQEEHFQDVFGDPDIHYHGQDIDANGNASIIFRSRTNNYRIYLRLRRAVQVPGGPAPHLTTGGETRVRYNRHWYSVEEFLELGVVPGRRNIFNLRLFEQRRPQIHLEIPQLEINPEIQFQIRNLHFLQQQIPNAAPVPPAQQIPQIPPNTETTDSDSQTNQPNPLAGNMLRTEDPEIDWLAINNELALRGVFMDDQLASSVVSVWHSNYRFFNETLGISDDTSTLLTNATISRAVGSGLSYDFPTIMEETNRELDSTPIMVPVSDILMFIFDQTE
jgi:hypothetical protein